MALVVAALAAAGLAAGPSRHGAAADRPVPLASLIGQRFVGAVDGTTAGPRLLARIRAGQLGGVILYSNNFATDDGARRLIARLQAAARAGRNPPLLVAVDQEGGDVRRLRAGPPALSAADMGRLGAAAAAREGAKTGTYLRRIGVNVDLAPVLDAPSVNHWLGARAFSRAVVRVTRVGVAFGRAVQRGGTAATAKHFPGLGAAPANTDEAVVTVSTSRSQLLRDAEPFRAAIGAGIRLVMVSNAAYPALVGSARPAVLSRVVVTSLLRNRFGFRGVVISDALETPAIERDPSAPVDAIRAGTDLLLYTGGEAGAARAYAAALAAARAGRFNPAELAQSYGRIMGLKRWLRTPRTPGS